jgi:ribosomal protein S27E
MTVICPIHEGGSKTVNLPLFLITLPWYDRNQEILKLNSQSHTVIKIEAYRAQTGLTQCYDCKQFGIVLANCRQSVHCLWCGRGNLHRECPEKRKERNSHPTPTATACWRMDRFLTCPLTEAVVMQRRRCQRRNLKATSKGPVKRLLSSMYITPEHSFAAALHRNTQQKHQNHQIVQPQQVLTERKMLQSHVHWQQQHIQQSSGQPVQTLYLHSVTG